ncbi:MAG: hypothetical protein COV74_00785 [Candidatus Omnitrophica bacterium CG11_big_fil_rev_8_21_14_0_20_45_26]|uniref:Acriflavin resistance protein n=1 Tax=Candidatus Abzuiibacterium crystallinum TaxID=1974748 RepID=A0A2H0LSN5_9BACT|nr:MAG: hypothetical protein COV74_00785 [Candidatus Omnitrophica bacterium CG11_big_fil_rev_8_21_14_0_20_45_26]PIW64858.1 MAG: hypothetical protein COW12_04545 [Candidatus Omnitrophica bacterium CG12_big_fil_rev_8_21_14_0_65_45_16]
MGIPRRSVNRPVFASVVFITLVLLGVLTLVRLPVELYQGLSNGIISVMINARGGLAPREVEEMITKPVEEAVSTTSGLKVMYSNSREAQSRVTLEFEPGEDMDFASLEVREKFSRVKSRLPPEIEKPVIANYSDTDNAILIFAVISDTKTPEELREVVDNELKPVLERLNGVASVEIYGGRERKILVELDRDKMVAYQISIEEVMDIIGASNLNLLAGDYHRGDYQFAIRTMGSFTSIDEIGDIGVKVSRQGTVIPLKEIATIKDSYLEPNDFSRLNLNQNVSVYVRKISTANTIRVVKGCLVILNDYNALKQNQMDDVRTVIVADRAESIQQAIRGVVTALLIGVLLVTLIIYVVLRSGVLAAIVFAAIPVSVISAFLFMGMFGQSINVMTLSGMAISIGILVDSTVVVTENVFKKREEGLAANEAVVAGAEEMWLALVASLVTNLIVFLPILFIDKEIQLQYGGFAFTVCATQILSLLVAISLIPMLLSRVQFDVHKSESGQKTRTVEKTLNQFYGWYEKALRFSFQNRYSLLVLILALFVAATWGLAHRDLDLPTTLNENEFKITIFPLAGAKLEANDEVVKKIEEMLHAYPEVNLISSMVRKDQINIFTKLVSRHRRKNSKDAIMTTVREKGNEAIKQVHEEYSLIVDEGSSSEEAKKLVLNIFGLENSELERLAKEIASRVQQVPGLTNLVMTDLRKRPEYSLVVDKARAAYYGFTVKDVANSVHALVRGMRPTKYHELTEGKEIEVITRLQPMYRQKIDDLRQIYLISKRGDQIPLEQIASFYPSTGPQTIDRLNKYRYVFLKADVSRPLETVAKEVKRAIKDIQFPKDYFWRFGGTYQSLIKGRSQSYIALLVTIIFIYMVLACFFQSYSQPLMIMIAIPLASIGIWMALAMTQKPLSQNVFLGMILLAGYVVNNSIILIDRINHLKSEIHDTVEQLIQAGKDRLRPILITTVATVLGFLPMTLPMDESSALWAPLAVTVIGGIISSTLLTLFVIPNFFLYLNDFKSTLVRARTGHAKESGLGLQK